MIAQATKKSERLFPLSSSQARIWFMEELDREITAYNIPLDFKITGDLDLLLLQESIDFLVRRHDSLRTVFPDQDGQPFQRILPDISSRINVVHLEHDPNEKQDEILALHSLNHATRKFDLRKGPLFHFELLVLDNNEYLFLANFHHIVSDATSVGIFFNELQTIYTSLSEGAPVSLPEIPMHYADFAIREKEWITTPEYRRQLDFWKQELEGAPDMLQLPTDRRRPKMQTYRGTEYHFTIGGSLRQRIAELGKRHRTGLFVPLLTAFSTLLSRYASQQDLIIGVPVANRREEDLDQLVGVLINTLPLRLNLTDPLSFSEAIETVKRKFGAAFENQEVPFERLVEELKVKRNTGTSPLFQVLFNYLTGFRKELRMPGVTFRMVHGERRSSQADLTLAVSDEKNELVCTVEYNTDLFEPETIERLAGHYITLLDGAARDESADIREIPILTQAESTLILDAWNDTAMPYPSDQCTHHQFEEQALRTPERIAVADEQVQLTYNELNARANRLAHYLVNRGAGEDTFIAVYLERTANLVISLLAVAKSGATYLPLDPIFPKTRIGMILEDARPVIVLTEHSLLADLPQSITQTVLVDDPSLFRHEPDQNLPFGNPRKAAYILYTSGSTGKPKGVLVKHHSTVNIVRSLTRLMEVTADDILLSATTFTFDVAEMELYLPLFNGAKLVMATQETASNPDLLKERITGSGATLFLATPVTFKMLVMRGWEGKPDLRVLSGGEGLPKELAAEMLSRCKKVFNGYAPTETTIYSLIHEVGRQDVDGDGYVLLGRPIDNTVLYVLNSKGIPVPAGIPGELYIGGEGVSAGYLNLPELTAARFITDPTGKNPGMLFYRTGDLVNYTPSGQVNFLNRLDSQVKIRGFRIELGEVESAIAQFPGIKEQVVIVRASGSGEKMLVAYIIPDQNQKIHIHELTAWMKSRLPEYMVPSAFVLMDEFPLTSTLKVDRNALPEPEMVSSAASSAYVAPATPTEKKLAEIWSSLLNIRKIGIRDDFFEIGGHSMIAVSLVVRIEKELGMRIPLASLFERSTIFHMAEMIDRGNDAVQWRSLVPIRPAGTRKPLFLVHGMGLNVLLYTTVVNYLDPEQPVYGLQAKGLNGQEEPLGSIEEIATWYISEIMTVDPAGPYCMAGFSLGGRIAYEMARQLTAAGKQVRFLGVFDASADETFMHLPFRKRLMKQMNHLLNYTVWNIGFFLRSGHESKWSVIRRRWKGLQKRFRGLDFEIDKHDLVSHGTRNELPKYLRRVHRANSRADRQYVIRPYNGTVHLFKAQKQTFYIADPVAYGWDKVARGGVVVHEVPGEHSSTFAPPNDKYFAELLQRSLDTCER